MSSKTWFKRLKGKLALMLAIILMFPNTAVAQWIGAGVVTAKADADAPVVSCEVRRRYDDTLVMIVYISAHVPNNQGDITFYRKKYLANDTVPTDENFEEHKNEFTTVVENYRDLGEAGGARFDSIVFDTNDCTPGSLYKWCVVAEYDNKKSSVATSNEACIPVTITGGTSGNVDISGTPVTYNGNDQKATISAVNDSTGVIAGWLTDNTDEYSIKYKKISDGKGNPVSGGEAALSANEAGTYEVYGEVTVTGLQDKAKVLCSFDSNPLGTFVINMATPATPGKPALTGAVSGDKKSYKVTATPNPSDTNPLGLDYEYSFKVGNGEWGEWGSSNTYSTVQSEKISAKCRFKATDNTNASSESAVSDEVTAPGVTDAPVITPDDATFIDSLDVTITAKDGERIFYTTNGNDPTVESDSIIKTKTLNINKETTIKACALADGKLMSSIASKSYAPGVKITGIEVSPMLGTVEAGKKLTLTSSFLPSDANEDATVTWTSGNTSVATVDSSGVVTGVETGKTTITASVTAANGTFTDTCDVEVVGDAVIVTGMSISPNPASVGKGKKTQLTAAFTPSNQTENPTVTWSSGNTGIATVDSTGLVTGVAAGSTTITASINSGAITAECKVTVTDKQEPADAISLKNVKIDGFKGKMPYTGSEVKQDVTLSYKNEKLAEGKDYTVTYMNNYDLGTATVIFEAINDGTGKYKGSVEKDFKITGKYTLVTEGKEENCTISLAADEYPYANGPIKPEVTVKAMLVNNKGVTEERVLTPGKDYTVSYKNNKAVAAKDAVNAKNGKDAAPQVVVKGKGNYVFADTKDMKNGAVKRFAITQCDISELVLTVNDFVYSTKADKYKNTKIQFFNKDYKNVKLKAKKDYTADFVTSDGSDTPAAGQTVTVTITATKDSAGNYTGNYKGTATVTYRIVGNKKSTDISKAKAIVNPGANGKAQACTYTGSAIEPGKDGQPALKVTFGSGKNLITLKEGEDFEIVGYYNNVAKGKDAVILIKGLGTFHNTKAVKFKIK